MSAVRSGPRGAEDRLRRLLVMLPWLMERGEVSVAETAQRFDLTEAEIAKDLELVAMCGLPPFVDELIDVFIDDGNSKFPRIFDMIYSEDRAFLFQDSLGICSENGIAQYHQDFLRVHQ